MLRTAPVSNRNRKRFRPMVARTAQLTAGESLFKATCGLWSKPSLTFRRWAFQSSTRFHLQEELLGQDTCRLGEESRHLPQVTIEDPRSLVIFPI